MKQLKINPTTCIGCASCAGLCPGTFAVNGPTATVTNPMGNSEEEIAAAAASCPTQSITYEEQPAN